MIKVTINYYGVEEIHGEFNSLKQVNIFLSAFDLQPLTELEDCKYYDEGRLVILSIEWPVFYPA